MTAVAWREAPPEPMPLRQEPTWQLQHIRDHLRGAYHLTESELDRYMLVVDGLCKPLSFASIAGALGEGWTRSMVESRWITIRDVLLLEPNGAGRMPDAAMGRIALLRRVHGLDPCWCEF